MKFMTLASKAVLVVLLAAAVCGRAADSPIATVKGYVLDSACAFTKGLHKPISKECATSCANAGSQLVILADDGTIYWPIADTTPSSGRTRSFCRLLETKSPQAARFTNGVVLRPS